MDVTMASSPEEKVRLFRAMFRGREDVYARRYVSAKSGKSGYSPVCSVEWTRGVCDNPTFHVRGRNPSGCWGFGHRSSLHSRVWRLGDVA